VIRGERIYLRGVERDDLDRCHAWMADPELRKTLAQRLPLSLAREADWVERATRGQDPSEMNFAICLGENGRHIGNCGLTAIDRDNRNANLGVFIGEPDCRGKGLGEDAVRTLCRFAFNELDLHKICLEAYAFNAGPIRTYERVGFRHEGLLREDAYRQGRRVDVVVMGLLRGEMTEPARSNRKPETRSRKPAGRRGRRS
jgi:RimJ/RimL family protein N-acetyltransferase